MIGIASVLPRPTGGTHQCDLAPRPDGDWGALRIV